MLANVEAHVHACKCKWHHVMSLMPRGSKNGTILSPQYVIFTGKNNENQCFLKRPIFHFGTHFGHIGGLLGPSWGHLGSFWGHLGPSWGYVVGHMNHLGTSLGHLGRPWGALGASSRPSWHPLSHLDASWPIWRPPGEHLGTIWMPFCSFWIHFWIILVACWHHF